MAIQTYEDIMASDNLRSVFAQGNANLKKIISVGPAQMRVLRSRHDAPPLSDDVTLMFDLAEHNLIEYLAEEAECDDAAAQPGVEEILRAKPARVSASEEFQK